MEKEEQKMKEWIKEGKRLYIYLCIIVSASLIGLLGGFYFKNILAIDFFGFMFIGFIIIACFVAIVICLERINYNIYTNGKRNRR